MSLSLSLSLLFFAQHAYMHTYTREPFAGISARHTRAPATPPHLSPRTSSSFSLKCIFSRARARAERKDSRNNISKLMSVARARTRRVLRGLCGVRARDRRTPYTRIRACYMRRDKEASRCNRTSCTYIAISVIKEEDRSAFSR